MSLPKPARASLAALAVGLVASLLVWAPLHLQAQSTSVDVGTGAPDVIVRQQFVNAYFRNGFANLVSLPPIADVRRFGTTGLIQEFNDAARTTGVRLALVKPTSVGVEVEGQLSVFQVTSLVYSLYTSVGVTTAGYPTMDTANCLNTASGTCFFQLFDRNYALFAYTVSLSGGQTFTVRDPYFTLWRNAGGIATLGPATSAETTGTSSRGSAFTMQSFSAGLIFNITGGLASGKQLVVTAPVVATYLANGGPTGFLGLPLNPPTNIGNGRLRLQFEGGAIDYDPNGTVVLRRPVETIGLSITERSFRLKLGESRVATAFPRASTGEDLPDRIVSWSTTNSRVVTISATGNSATLRAVGGGVATVTATTEGKLSSPIQIFVEAPCCQIGEGAPTAATAQAFQDALTRNRLTVQLPNPTLARRSGNGYVQELVTVGTATRLLVALPDTSSQAWVVLGGFLNQYEQLGGPTGPLGYPTSDQTASGRQNFAGGALAGNPLQVVSGPILAKWALLNYEAGAAGAPAAPVTSFFTFSAATGFAQTFRNGLIVAHSAGANSGKNLLVSGPILAKFLAEGGLNGPLGAPVTDEFSSSGLRRQDFEGGRLEYPIGGTEVSATLTPRRPELTALPATVVAGSRVRLALGGFTPGSPVRVRATSSQASLSQAEFTVQAANGAYAWELFVPDSSPSATVTVTATGTGGQSATTVYTVRAAAETQPRLLKVRGDSQVAAPGAELPIPLRVSLRDESGNALVGVAVAFRGSPGATVRPASALTDSNGEAETTVRMPASEGTALFTAEAMRRVVTFQALGSGSGLRNFPNLKDPGNPYLTATAALFRYYTDRGDLSVSGTTNAALDAYLRAFCTIDAQANQVCDGYLGLSALAGARPEVPNLWRLAAFANNSFEWVPVAIPDPLSDLALRDALSLGPVLVSLALESGESHAVVATGVGVGGSLEIMDPSPVFGRPLLSDYLNGFSWQGRSYKGRIVGALRLSPRPPQNPGFLVVAALVPGATATDTGLSVASPSGACGAPFAIAAGPQSLHFQYCDGAASGASGQYQVEIRSSARFQGRIVDLSTTGPTYQIEGQRQGTFRLARPGSIWESSPLEAAFQANSVVNAANFQPGDLAPGGIFTIFGIGLARSGAETTVEIGGLPAAVLFASAFQVNAQVPPTLSPGTYPLLVRSPYSTAEATVEVREVAPAIFSLGAGRYAVTNSDGSLNGPTNPARRGSALVLYGTGFGAVRQQGTLRVAERPVTATLGGSSAQVAFAGLTPGFIGLYQVNVTLASAMPPGLFLSLELAQGGVALPPITVAVQ